MEGGEEADSETAVEELGPSAGDVVNFVLLAAAEELVNASGDFLPAALLTQVCHMYAKLMHAVHTMHRSYYSACSSAFGI
jgi:hypothetical protein